MCRPDYYAVRYEINPWMNRQVQPSHEMAVSQWNALTDVLRNHLNASLEFLSPTPDHPDLVFTANAGYVSGKMYIPARFRFPERRGEEPVFRSWFEKMGYKIHDLPGECFFEGFGDALPYGGMIFAGYRFRSDIRSHQELGRRLGKQVISLELANRYFYHLDTCLCPLDGGDLVFYPGAFDSYGLEAIQGAVPREKLIPVSEDEAASFCCNAVAVENRIAMNDGAPELCSLLERRGYSIRTTNLSEFLKSGGSAKCLTLRLD